MQRKDKTADLTPLIVVHGNSVRALVRHLDGTDATLDPEAAAEAAEAVANQGR